MMQSRAIYLDNCATTRTCEEAAAAALCAMREEYGNPASLHYFGAVAHQKLGVARSQVAQVLGAATDEIVFTSGATEANNLALLGAMRAQKARGHLVSTQTEHASVLAAAAQLQEEGHSITYVAPMEDGTIDPGAVAAAVKEDTVLVSVARVNNETGAVAPLAEIVRQVKAKNPRTLVHTDDVQGFGKLPCKVWDVQVDMLSLSGHKIHAPKGVGALYVRKGVCLQPLQYGGKQEKALRPGTESVPLICALGAASHAALGGMARNEQHVAALQAQLKKQLVALPGVVLSLPQTASPYILHLSVPGHKTDALVTALSMREIYLSGGAACSRGEQSHVLQAMGLPEERLQSALRIGLSRQTTAGELDAFVKNFAEVLWELQPMNE